MMKDVIVQWYDNGDNIFALACVWPVVERNGGEDVHRDCTCDSTPGYCTIHTVILRAVKIRDRKSPLDN